VYLHTIDIAHPPMSSDEAEAFLDETLRMVKASSNLRVLKIIHGQGSAERPARLKDVAKNWAYRNRSRLRAVVAGEEYQVFNATIQALRKECGQEPDADLGAANAGITIVWIK
jgi:hypothetical protein